MAVAIVTSLVSIPYFWRLNDSVAGEVSWFVNDAPWLLYLVSLGALAVAVGVWERGRRVAADPTASRAGRRRKQLELGAVAAFFVVALVVRFGDLERIPHGLWFDEAQNGLAGLGLLTGDAVHSAFLGGGGPAGFTQMGASYFYLQGAVLEVFGRSIFALRVLPALAGALTVPLVYLLASRLYGRRVAVASASLLAFSAWNLTFSRIGIASMATVALDVATYLCVVLGLRSGRLGWYAAGGVLLGFALQGYYVSRLTVLVLLAILAHIAIGDWRKAWALRSGVAVFAAAGTIAVLPVAVFAAQKPDEFNQRISTVSIFSQDDPKTAFAESLRDHLLMFNYRGDENGRHNEPGSPMLDWVTGALFLCGLVMCLVRVRRWQYFFPLAWFAASLSGGVLSLPFEAPQAHRTLENSIVTALFGGIALGELWAAGTRASPARVWRVATTVVAAGLLAIAAVMNLDAYFVRQARDANVWAEMGAAQEAAGRAIARYSRTHDAWVAPVYADSPVLSFLAPGLPERSWPGALALPLEGDRERGALILLPPEAEPDVALAASMYPGAVIAALRAPGSDVPLSYAIAVPPAQIRAVRGAVALGSSGRRVVLAHFGVDEQVDRLGERASVVSTLKVPISDSYRFTWPRHGWHAVLVDGNAVERGRALQLAAGLHRLEADVAPRDRVGRSRLRWTSGGGPYSPIPPSLLFDPRRIGPHGLVGSYRIGETFAGPPDRLIIDPEIALQFHAPPVGPPFTVEWNGEFYAPKAGRYAFGTEQIDTATLAIDGRAVLANRMPNKLVETSVSLRRGWHDVTLRYRARTGHFHVYLFWTPPGASREIVPTEFLRPHGTGGPPQEPFPKRGASALEGRVQELSENGELPG
jgi:4-amino-4-deoxy-L-arabinose transferase-like glycosyltransferase